MSKLRLNYKEIILFSLNLISLTKVGLDIDCDTILEIACVVTDEGLSQYLEVYDFFPSFVSEGSVTVSI